MTRLQVKDIVVKYLGDQHLGKSFVHGVPLARRGEREAMQWDDFSKSLNDVQGVDVHVNMGDMFDKAVVPYTVVMKAALIYQEAAEKNPDVEYYLINGNHDLSRDLDRFSAFNIFKAIIGDHRNIRVVEGTPEVLEVGSARLVFLPWNPVTSAAEMVDQNWMMLQDADAVFGHWDVMAVEDTSNLIPAQHLAQLGVKLAVTGHDHTSRRIQIEGLDVIVTGSMQPYSFSEDPQQRMYVTYTLEEYLELTDVDLRNKCVRITLDRGQRVENVPDCLLFKVQYRDLAEEDGEIDTDVDLGDFSFDRVFEEVMVEIGVDPEFIGLTKKRIDEERAKQ